MAESSRRAAKPQVRGGLPNALFVVAAAERIPDELRGVADVLTIHFPWGSLLRGTLALDDAAARGIAALLNVNAKAIATFSIEQRDGLDLPELDHDDACLALKRRWSKFGVEVCALRPAAAGDLHASTWARRLAAGRDRRAWRLELAGAHDAIASRG